MLCTSHQSKSDSDCHHVARMHSTTRQSSCLCMLAVVMRWHAAVLTHRLCIPAPIVDRTDWLAICCAVKAASCGDKWCSEACFASQLFTLLPPVMHEERHQAFKPGADSTCLLSHATSLHDHMSQPQMTAIRTFEDAFASHQLLSLLALEGSIVLGVIRHRCSCLPCVGALQPSHGSPVSGKLY